MSTYAADRTREAWDRYAERLRGLEGRPYDDAESEAWEELQAELQGIDQELTVVGATGTGS